MWCVYKPGGLCTSVDVGGTGGRRQCCIRVLLLLLAGVLLIRTTSHRGTHPHNPSKQQHTLGAGPCTHTQPRTPHTRTCCSSASVISSSRFCITAASYISSCCAYVIFCFNVVVFNVAEGWRMDCAQEGGQHTSAAGGSCTHPAAATDTQHTAAAASRTAAPHTTATTRHTLLATRQR